MPEFNDWFPTSQYGTNVLNVMDFGAVGNGSTDDRAAIQSCFDAAFGTKEAPNGEAGKHTNKSVYLPAGNYRVTGPLYLTGVQGGRVFGNGAKSTQISYEYTDTGNYWIADPDNGSEITPCIMQNGCAYMLIEGIHIGSNSGGEHGDVGIFVFTDGSAGLATCTQYRNLIVGGFGVGILVGWGGSGGNCDNGSLYNVNFDLCTIAGLKCHHQNALNWQVYGGGATSCGWDGDYDPVTPAVGSLYAGAYSTVGGSIGIIQGVSMSGNKWDFFLASSSPTVILGGSSESPGGGSPHPTGGCCVSLGSPVFLSGFAYRNEFSDNSVFMEGVFGAEIHCSACIFNPGNASGAGKIANLGANSHLIIDDMIFGGGAVPCGIYGSGNSLVYARNLSPFDYPNSTTHADAMFANFTGHVLQMDLPPGPISAAASPKPRFPAAAAKFRGLIGVITDSTTATVGDSITGGGSNKVFAYCDGANWKVIGTVAV